MSKVRDCDLVAYATAIEWLVNHGFSTPEQGNTEDGIVLRGGSVYRGGYGEDYEVVLYLDPGQSFTVYWRALSRAESGWDKLEEVLDSFDEE